MAQLGSCSSSQSLLSYLQKVATCAMQTLTLMAGLCGLRNPSGTSCGCWCWCRAGQPFLGRSSHSFDASFCFPLPPYHCYGRAVQIVPALHRLLCSGSCVLERVQHSLALCLPFPGWIWRRKVEWNVVAWGWKAGLSCRMDRQGWCCRQGLLCRVSLPGPWLCWLSHCGFGCSRLLPSCWQSWLHPSVVFDTSRFLMKLVHFQSLLSWSVQGLWLRVFLLAGSLSLLLQGFYPGFRL